MSLRTRIAVPPLVLVLLASCVAVTPSVVPTAAPAAEAGYVAGLFLQKGGPGYGFVLVDAAGHELVMPFGNSAHERPRTDAWR